MSSSLIVSSEHRSHEIGKELGALHSQIKIQIFIAYYYSIWKSGSFAGGCGGENGLFDVVTFLNGVFLYSLSLFIDRLLLIF